MLKAEWSVLSQPSRLQAVITKYPEHFKLEPFSADQMATLADLPAKPIDGVPDQRRDLGRRRRRGDPIGEGGDDRRRSRDPVRHSPE